MDLLTRLSRGIWNFRWISSSLFDFRLWNMISRKSAQKRTFTAVYCFFFFFLFSPRSSLSEESRAGSCVLIWKLGTGKRLHKDDEAEPTRTKQFQLLGASETTFLLCPTVSVCASWPDLRAQPGRLFYVYSRRQYELP